MGDVSLAFGEAFAMVSCSILASRLDRAAHVGGV